MAAALETLTSGQKCNIPGGALQAHVCVVASQTEVAEVIATLQEADAFHGAVSFAYAHRIAAASAPEVVWEDVEDGLDEGCGEKILGVLRNSGLKGMLLIVSRWQDCGSIHDLDSFGHAVVERCTDLITHLKQAFGMTDDQGEGRDAADHESQKPPSDAAEPKSFDFGFLPSLPEPRVPTKFCPNHFMADTHLNRPQSLPNLFGGGDVRLWMENDKCLRQLSETDLRALRAMREPDCRIQRVLQAVSCLLGKQPHRIAGNAAARWGQCREVLRSGTFLTELLLFDPSTVTSETARHAMQMVEGLEVADLRRANVGSAALLEWVHGVATWRVDGPPCSDASAFGLQALQGRRAELPGICAPASVMQRPPRHRSGLGPNMLGPSSRQRRKPVQLRCPLTGSLRADSTLLR